MFILHLLHNIISIKHNSCVSYLRNIEHSNNNKYLCSCANVSDDDDDDTKADTKRKLALLNTGCSLLDEIKTKKGKHGSDNNNNIKNACAAILLFLVFFQLITSDGKTATMKTHPEKNIKPRRQSTLLLARSILFLNQ